MANKKYVQEQTEVNADGEELVTVNVYDSEPIEFDYLIFLDK